MSGPAAAAMIAYQLYSGIAQSESIKDNALTMDLINKINQENIEIDAWEAIKAGESNAAHYEGVVNKVIQDQRSTFAGSNVDVTFGSAASLQRETEVQGMIQTADIKNAAHTQALGIRREGLNLRAQGQINSATMRAKASAAIGAGVVNGLSTAVSAYTKAPPAKDTNNFTAGVDWMDTYGNKQGST